MINTYIGTQSNLARIDTWKRGAWINVVNPTSEEIEKLCSELGIPRDFVTYPLDVDERARTDREGTIILILLKIPYFRGEEVDIPYGTLLLGIILTPEQIVTVCKVETDIIGGFIEGTGGAFDTAKRHRFVLRLLLRTATRYLRYLREINREVNRLEDELEQSMRNQEVLQLLKYQKSLTYFTTGLRSNEVMMERLQRSGFFDIYPEDGELLEDVITENRQAIEMVGIASDILSQMMDAFASIISNNLNVVMKVLTSVTIILTFPTIVASFYGMNVALPLQELPYAFWLTLAMSVGVSAAVGVYFLRKNWL